MIIAVDFDGTICENRWPNIGIPNRKLIKRLIRLKEQGNKIILWTMRTHAPFYSEGETERDLLHEAVAFCEAQGLCFDAVNEPDPENARRFGNDSRKVYADVYIDDHNAPGTFMRKFLIPFSRSRKLFDVLLFDGLQDDRKPE